MSDTECRRKADRGTNYFREESLSERTRLGQVRRSRGLHVSNDRLRPTSPGFRCGGFCRALARALASILYLWCALTPRRPTVTQFTGVNSILVIVLTRRKNSDCFDFEQRAVAGELRHFQRGASRRCGDIHEFITHLAINGQLRADIGQEGVELHADAFDGRFQVLVDERRLLAKIRPRFAGGIIPKLSRDINRAIGPIHLEDVGVTGRLRHGRRIAELHSLRRRAANHYEHCADDMHRQSSEVTLHNRHPWLLMGGNRTRNPEFCRILDD